MPVHASLRRPPTVQDLKTSFVARSITLLGLDGIGRSVAMQMAMLGACRLHLVDTRRVDRGRAALEGYFQTDVGSLRAAATGQLCHEVQPMMCVQSVTDGKLRARDLGETVIAMGGPWLEQLSVACRPGWMFFVGVQVVVHREIIALRRWDGYASPGSLAARLNRWRKQQRANCCAPHIAAVAAGLVTRELTSPMEDRPARTQVRMDVATLDVRVEKGPDTAAGD
ncbi:MAG: hypothetical protein ACKVP6_11025 [Mycobacterium sp.]